MCVLRLQNALKSHKSHNVVLFDFSYALLLRFSSNDETYFWSNDKNPDFYSVFLFKETKKIDYGEQLITLGNFS